MDKDIQAFPAFEHYTDGNRVITGSPHGGMTLRDYFAGQALPAVIRITEEYKYEHIAKECYLLADALINQRLKKD